MRLPVYVLISLLVAAGLAGCFGTPEDEDGLTADAEREGWTISIEKADGTTESRDVTSDPHKEDTDGDGIDDFQEMLSATDPRKADTDGDGLKDGYDQTLDADSDLAKDWFETGLANAREGDQVTFFGEWDHQAEPAIQDTDEDGLLDGEEIGGFAITVCGEERTVRTSARQPDSDNDHVLDPDEAVIGTDPSVKDTDGDGVGDLTDVEPCGDLWATFDVLAFTPHGDASGPFEVQVSFDGDPVPWSSESFDAEEGVETDVASEAGALDVDDDQGNLRDRDFNITFTVRVYSGGESDRRTLAITGSGASEAIFRFDVRTGHITIAGEGPGADATAGSSGPDGSVRVSLKAQIGP